VDDKTGLMMRIVTYFRTNGTHFLVELLVNFILPFAIYSYAAAPLGDVRALLLSSAPPIAWSLIEFARHRRADAVSMLVLAGIALSLLAMIGGGGAKFLQLREKLVTIIISFAFLGSAAIGRPLIYELAKANMRRSNNQEQLQRFETMRNNAGFRRAMMLMTLVWGFGMLADALASIALVFTVSIKQYLLVNPILGYSTMGVLSLWTFWYARKRQREGEALRAAEAARAAEDAQAAELAAKPAD